MSQVELYMAELYNKIGLGLITWSPLSLGLCSSKPEDQFSLFTKLAVKVRGGVGGGGAAFSAQGRCNSRCNSRRGASGRLASAGLGGDASLGQTAHRPRSLVTVGSG